MYMISPIVVKLTHPNLPGKDFGVTLDQNPTDEDWEACLESLRRMIEKALDQKGQEL